MRKGDGEEGRDDGHAWSEPDEELRERMLAAWEETENEFKNECVKNPSKERLMKQPIEDMRCFFRSLDALSGSALEAAAAKYGVWRLTLDDVVQEIHEL
ncbi:MAG: hypothetical protein KF764_31490 [Labilithrix sp.]|nr:hypothetical protein [Labilithrix sp.]